MLHIAAVALTAVLTIGVWMAMPELTAALTCALWAPSDSAASAHNVVTSAAAEESTLPISWLHTPGLPFSDGEFSCLPMLLLISATAAASCVSERAACNCAGGVVFPLSSSLCLILITCQGLAPQLWLWVIEVHLTVLLYLSCVCSFCTSLGIIILFICVIRQQEAP